jgi:hypothetical protein
MTPAEEQDAVESIRTRVRDNNFNYSDTCMEGMVAQMLYEEDVVRAMGDARYMGRYPKARRPTFAFVGPGVDGDPIAVFCTPTRARILIVSVFRFPGLPPERN